MRVSKVAELAGCGKRTVQRACVNDDIPGARLIEGPSGEKEWFIPEEAGRAWAEAYAPDGRGGQRCSAPIGPRRTCDAALDKEGRCWRAKRHL